LIKRLRGPRPPPTWLERKKCGQYIPTSYDTGNAATTLNQFNVYARSILDSEEFEPSVLYIMHAIVERYLKFKSMYNDNEIIEHSIEFKLMLENIFKDKGIEI